MATSKLSTKGRIVVPAAVRNDLRIAAGSPIEFVKTEAGWLLKPVANSITNLKGVLRKKSRRPSIEDMRQAVRTRCKR